MPTLTDQQKDDLLDRAEQDIRGILIDLYNDHGIRVLSAQIDTRNHAEFSTSLDWRE